METTPTKQMRCAQRTMGNRWLLQEAKARLSELIRQAQGHGPQHVRLHGRDAIVDAVEFAHLQRRTAGRDLVEALQSSSLGDIEMRETFRKVAGQSLQYFDPDTISSRMDW